MNILYTYLFLFHFHIFLPNFENVFFFKMVDYNQLYIYHILRVPYITNCVSHHSHHSFVTNLSLSLSHILTSQSFFPTSLFFLSLILHFLFFNEPLRVVENHQHLQWLEIMDVVSAIKTKHLFTIHNC